MTLQGALRFGRDGNGATVYVNTNTLPEWVPSRRVGGVLTTKGNGERQVVAALTDLGGTATTGDVADHDAVTVSKKTVRRVLAGLADDGRGEKEWRGGQNIYTVSAFGGLNEHATSIYKPTRVRTVHTIHRRAIVILIGRLCIVVHSHTTQ